MATLEACIEAELACGRHADVVGELEQICRRHPLRERLWGQWMLALYRCSRQADALAAYQLLRTTLADELGLDPGPELRRLEGASWRRTRRLTRPPLTSRLPVRLCSTRRSQCRQSVTRTTSVDERLRRVEDGGE
jgi:DNA-binding SARP family transcriptional activator